MLGAENLVAGLKGETPPNLIKGSIGVK
jgi:gluconate 2-dehydrogenase